MSEIYDLIVIGGGSAGLVVAGGAATLGAKIALIEKRALGGDCLYTGCVPSKALIRSARFAADVKKAKEFGFEIENINFAENSFASITNRISRVIKTIEPHDSPQRFEKMGVEVVFGSPRFLNPTEVEIELKDGGKRQMRAKRFCLSTGSSPTIPPVEGLQEAGFLTNENVFELQALPRRLIILGGGAIGAELGQSFARFGSKVTMVEMGDRLLAKEDIEVSDFMEKVFRDEGIEILTQTKATGVRIENGKKVLIVEKNSKKSEIEADEILVATGRKPNIEGLDLEKANVKFNEKRVETDEFLRTSARHIFAAGDVTGHYQFTHTADYEGQIVIQNAFLFYGLRKKTDFRVVPWATFTSPEIGRVGLTESEAREKFGDGVKIYKITFDENDRAQTDDEAIGFAKVVCKQSGEIVGAHLVGASGGELIHEFVWAMKKRLRISQLNEIIRVYPTLSKITQAVGTEATLENLKSPFVQKWFAKYLKVWR
ncbi:MAG: mercuric reductase [Pyrinomonadaceae bacterium]